MNIYQRSEKQEASREIEMEDEAGEPRAGNEECDSPDRENREISKRTPRAVRCRRCFPLGVVAGDPEILRGMHYGKYASAIAALRNLESFQKRQKCRHQKPHALGGKERE